MTFLLLRQVHCSDCGAHITAPVLEGEITPARADRAGYNSVAFFLKSTINMIVVGGTWHIFSPRSLNVVLLV